jgi:Fe2+ transport protein
MNIVRLTLFSATLLAASACVAAPGGASPATAPAAVASPVASPSPVASSLLGTPAANATSAVVPAVVEVSPSQLQAGAVTFTLSVDGAKHMLDQGTAVTSDPDAAHQAAGSGNPAGSTALVLQGMLQLTNNFTAAQSIPDDEAQSMLRHVNLQIRTGAGEAVPYLATSLDVLLDGHPVLANVPLLPMIAAEGEPQLYYGNNVKLTKRGMYQMFARVQPTPMLGKEPPPTAQFNVSVR